MMKDTGSRILLRSVDEFERLRGTNLAWFGLDELTYTHERRWLRLEGRLRDPKATRRCGFAVWTPKGFDWVYRKFIANPAEGYEAIQAKPLRTGSCWIRCRISMSGCKGSYDENFFRQEVLGDYLNVKGGLVYHAFDREAECAGSWTMDPAQPVVLGAGFQCGSDVFGGGAGGAVTARSRVLDEIVLRRATTEQACEEFEKRFGLPPAGVVVYGDASGASMQTTGYSDYQVIRSYFAARMAKVSYRVPKANPRGAGPGGAGEREAA